MEIGVIDNSVAIGEISSTSGKVGGLVGMMGLGVIDNSAFSGNVYGTLGVGGIIGNTESSNTFIMNSRSSGSVFGEIWVGGLIGDSLSVVTNSYSTSSVTGEGSSIGGLIGRQLGPNGISNSYATGNVEGFQNIAGLVGVTQNLQISNSYSTGDVNGVVNVGGFVGSVGVGVTLINTYSSGFVNGTDSETTGGYAGIVFFVIPDQVEFIHSYWDNDATNQLIGCGKDPNEECLGGVFGRTTEEMTGLEIGDICSGGEEYAENTYIDWDFVNIWQPLECNYPWFQWQGDSTAP